VFSVDDECLCSVCEDRVDDLLSASEVPVSGAGANTSVAGDVVEGCVQSALSEDFLACIQQALPVSRDVFSHRTALVLGHELNLALTIPF
jgi:hypothetical protein